jgi:AraC-like DNA-binding protein
MHIRQITATIKKIAFTTIMTMLENILQSLGFEFLIGGISLVEYKTIPAHNIWRQLPFWIIGYIQTDTPDSFFVEIPPDGKLTLNDKMLLSIPPNRIHQFTTTVDHRNISTWFHGKYSFDFGLDISDFVDIPLIVMPPVSTKIKRWIEDLLKASADESISALSKTVNQRRLGFEILHSLMPLAKEHQFDEMSHSDSMRIFQVLEYIDKNYFRSIDVPFLAGLIHLSPTHFNKLFRQVMHMSPMEFVRRTRMSKACEQLISTTLPVSEIARMVGYEDQYIFSRAFKTVMELSPQNYRKYTNTVMVRDVKKDGKQE